MPKKLGGKDSVVDSYADEMKRKKKPAAKQQENPVIKIVWRKMAELKPAEYNPRKISAAQRASLRAGMEKFGWAGAYAVINTNPERQNVIISAHQRIKVWQDLGHTECPCVEVNLSYEDERELNIRLNQNGGEFDNDLLQKFFDNEELVLFGFSASELPSIEEALGDDGEAAVPVAEDPVYPIVPKFNERYSMFCIMTENELDETWLRNVLMLQKMQSYKSESVAPSYVISCASFREALEKYAAEMRAVPDPGEDGDDAEDMEVMR